MIRITNEVTHALDNFRDSVGPVVAGTSELLHAGRIHPHSVGGGGSGTADPAVFGAPPSALTRAEIPQGRLFGPWQHIEFYFKEDPLKRSLMALMFSLVMLGTMAFATAKEDSVERLQNAGDVLKQIMDAPDKGIPEEVLDDAKCIVVVPHLIKAGFIFGGKHGRGVASCRTATGWSAPAFISVGGGSWGLQIGAEGVDLVMLVMNEKGLQHLLSSKFQLSGEGSAAAGPVGRHASAGTDWKLNTEILSYSRTKGIFAGLTLEGAVVQQDDDSTKAVYGSDPGFRAILSGRVPPPEHTGPFLKEVTAQAERAHAENK